MQWLYLYLEYITMTSQHTYPNLVKLTLIKYLRWQKEKNLYSKPSKNYFLTILLMTKFRGDK